MVIKQLKCYVCKENWISRKEKPKRCPKCRSTRWNLNLKSFIKTDFLNNPRFAKEFLLLQSELRTQKEIAQEVNIQQSNLNKDFDKLKKIGFIYKGKKNYNINWSSVVDHIISIMGVRENLLEMQKQDRDIFKDSTYNEDEILNINKEIMGGYTNSISIQKIVKQFFKQITMNELEEGKSIMNFPTNLNKLFLDFIYMMGYFDEMPLSNDETFSEFDEDIRSFNMMCKDYIYNKLLITKYNYFISEEFILASQKESLK